MLAALQGKATSPSHLNPYFGLHNPRFTSRCDHIKSCVDLLPLKDLHEFFPHLLANVFGFDQGPGWHLRVFSVKLHSDFETLLHFFSPEGDLFRLMAKLESSHYLYEFPITCLPLPTQLSLTEGHIPPLYKDKVDQSSHAHLHLTAFEYYIFHFAYYLISLQKKLQSSPYQTPLQESLYSHLLDKYLDHFLPPRGTLPTALTVTTPQRQGSPHQRENTPPGVFSSPHTPGLLRTNGDMEAHVVAMGIAGDQREAPLVQAEVVIQVLVEFWLNQNHCNGQQGDILTQAQNSFTPNEDHLLLTRRLTKHIHYFVNGSSFSPPHTTLIPLTDALRRNVIPMFIQKQLYYFLRYSFRHLPLDSTFRYILELWLTYIQPWRYTDPLRPSSENKESLEALPKRWRGFVLDNFAFFSGLLMEVIGRCFQLDLTADPGTTLLYRVTKVFSQPGLMGFIEYGESLLLNPEPSYSSSRTSPVVDACSIKALLMDLDGPMFNYQPLFAEDTLAAVQVLLDKVREARGVLTSRLSSGGASLQSSLPPPPVTPITPTAPTLHQSKRSWWRSVGDLFSDGQSANPSPPSVFLPHTTDPSKLLSLLETTESNIMMMFGLSTPPQYSPSDGSPQWRPGIPISVTPLRLVTPPASEDVPKSLDPEYVRGTSQLTPRGKMQLIQGLRKSTNLHVPYLGDPLLQPIRSYENAALVRCLHRWSTHLNNKFARQLQSIGVSNSFLSRFARQFLSPPTMSSPHSLITSNTDEPPHTPKSRVSHILTVPQSMSASNSPRFNFRPLASYYTLTSLSLLLVIIWLFLLPLWFLVLLVLSSVLVCMTCCEVRLTGAKKTE